jgi:hypothetical protein
MVILLVCVGAALTACVRACNRPSMTSAVSALHSAPERLFASRKGYNFAEAPALSQSAPQGVAVRTAQEWLDASKQMYQSLQSYSEDGLLESSLDRDEDISLSRWQLAMNRSGGFAFRWEQHGFLGTAPRSSSFESALNDMTNIYRIWQAPGASEGFVRWTVNADALENTTVRRATGAAFGVTQMTSGWTLALLNPTEFALRTPPLDLAQPKIRGYAMIDSHACVAVEGLWSEIDQETCVAYIDTQTLLVRRWERTQPARVSGNTSLSASREVWHVRPQANPTLSDAAFEEPKARLAPWVAQVSDSK